MTNLDIQYVVPSGVVRRGGDGVSQTIHAIECCLQHLPMSTTSRLLCFLEREGAKRSGTDRHPSGLGSSL